MKSLLSLTFAAALFGTATVSLGQTIVVPAVPVVVPHVTYYAPAVARTTYYAPAVTRTTYYAPATTTTYYAPAVTTYYAPAVTTYYAPTVVAPAGYLIPPPRFRLRRAAPALYVVP
jgi:hypothetical protein